MHINNFHKIHNTRISVIILIFIVIGFLSSCNFFGGSYVRTEFFLTNRTNYTLNVITSGTVFGPDRSERTYQDFIPPGDTISLRTINAAKEFQLKFGVFNEITISGIEGLSVKDPLDLNLWTKILDTKKKREYILIVDSTFFKHTTK